MMNKTAFNIICGFAAFVAFNFWFWSVSNTWKLIFFGIILFWILGALPDKPNK